MKNALSILLLSIVLFLSSVSRFGVGRASVRLIAEFVITKEHGKANIVAILSLAIGLIVSSFIAYLLQFEYYYGSVSEIFKIENVQRRRCCINGLSSYTKG